MVLQLWSAVVNEVKQQGITEIISEFIDMVGAKRRCIGGGQPVVPGRARVTICYILLHSRNAFFSKY